MLIVGCLQVPTLQQLAVGCLIRYRDCLTDVGLVPVELLSEVRPLLNLSGMPQLAFHAPFLPLQQATVRMRSVIFSMFQRTTLALRRCWRHAPPPSWRKSRTER